jgi:hypothetical protein
MDGKHLYWLDMHHLQHGEVAERELKKLYGTLSHHPYLNQVGSHDANLPIPLQHLKLM